MFQWRPFKKQVVCEKGKRSPKYRQRILALALLLQTVAVFSAQAATCEKYLFADGNLAITEAHLAMALRKLVRSWNRARIEDRRSMDEQSAGLRLWNQDKGGPLKLNEPAGVGLWDRILASLDHRKIKEFYESDFRSQDVLDSSLRADLGRLKSQLTYWNDNPRVMMSRLLASVRYGDLIRQEILPAESIHYLNPKLRFALPMKSFRILDLLFMKVILEFYVTGQLESLAKARPQDTDHRRATLFTFNQKLEEAKKASERKWYIVQEALLLLPSSESLQTLTLTNGEKITGLVVRSYDRRPEENLGLWDPTSLKIRWISVDDIVRAESAGDPPPSLAIDWYSQNGKHTLLERPHHRTTDGNVWMEKEPGKQQFAIEWEWSFGDWNLAYRKPEDYYGYDYYSTTSSQTGIRPTEFHDKAYPNRKLDHAALLAKRAKPEAISSGPGGFEDLLQIVWRLIGF